MSRSMFKVLFGFFVFAGMTGSASAARMPPEEQPRISIHLWSYLVGLVAPESYLYCGVTEHRDQGDIGLAAEYLTDERKVARIVSDQWSYRFSLREDGKSVDVRVADLPGGEEVLSAALDLPASPSIEVIDRFSIKCWFEKEEPQLFTVDHFSK